MERVIGIDLGTTNSVAAYIEDGRPVVIPNVEGDRLTPSVVAFTGDGKTWVGKVARRQAVANPQHTIFSIKRQMGRRAAWGLEDVPHNQQVVASIKRRMGSEYRVRVDGRDYTPQEISAMILRKVKQDAERYLGGPVERAVITVPAYFNDSQRRATQEAGALAGLEVLRIVNEPTAAALAYGLDRGNVHTILVWDLGGGTFDVSILELGDGVFEVKAVNGNTHLGGDDYDQRIMDHLAEQFRQRYGLDVRDDGRSGQSLREVAEQAKIDLSRVSATRIRLPLPALDGKTPPHLEATLTREEFEALTEDLLQQMVGPTERALADAGLDPIDIDRVVLVGGATRMPAIQRLITRMMGQEPFRHIDPDEVVALGAAIQAGVLTGLVRDVVLIDVNPLSLGIETQGGIFTKIIPRNTPIPTSKSQLFTTAIDDQTVVDIHVLQGEREMARQNMTLDRFRLSDITPQRRGEAKIEVTFHIDENSIVQVSAEDLQTENRQSVEITSLGTVSRDEIQRMLQEARTHAGEDYREREEVELAIRADSMVSAAEYLLKEAQELQPAPHVLDLMGRVDGAVLEVKEALASGESDRIRSTTEALKRQLDLLDRNIKGWRSGQVASSRAGEMGEAP